MKWAIISRKTTEPLFKGVFLAVMLKIDTGNVTERFSRGLLRALDVYEQQFGVSDIGMTETHINV